MEGYCTFLFNAICCIIISSICVILVNGQKVDKAGVGFPAVWHGDDYKELYCPSTGIPRFLDGYFLCQISASYGDPANENGRKLTHMIDAIGALGAFHISDGQVLFSASYYPSRPFKIWQYYDRNMSESSVPWAGWSDYNLTAMVKWEGIPPNMNAARFHPNLDFWKVGSKVVAATEAPYWVGYSFDVPTLSNFTTFPFTEDNEIFGRPKPTMVPISMAVHERNSRDGSLWGSFSAMNYKEKRFFQGVFTVDWQGVRRVVGMYDYGKWDPKACDKNDRYIGDTRNLPGYIHSITSTEKYIIIPISSLLINPCKFKEPPLTNPDSPVQKGGLWGMDFYEMLPMRILIFDKIGKEWVTQQPLEVFPSMFISHQLNAFDNPDGTIVADMMAYSNHDQYVKYFYTDFLKNNLYPSSVRVLRFVLDLTQARVMYNYILPQETVPAEFPQTNKRFEGRPYQWVYMVLHPYAAGNKILKANVDDPTGHRNVLFTADSTVVMHEPWFVARPNSTREDDGVLLIRGLDIADNKGILLVVDAITMKEVGRALVPISIPYGFHNRFYSKGELDLPTGFRAMNPDSQKTGFRPISKDLRKEHQSNLVGQGQHGHFVQQGNKWAPDVDDINIINSRRTFAPLSRPVTTTPLPKSEPLATTRYYTPPTTTRPTFPTAYTREPSSPPNPGINQITAPITPPPVPPTHITPETMSWKPSISNNKAQVPTAEQQKRRQVINWNSRKVGEIRIGGSGKGESDNNNNNININNNNNNSNMMNNLIPPVPGPGIQELPKYAPWFPIPLPLVTPTRRPLPSEYNVISSSQNQLQNRRHKQPWWVKVEVVNAKGKRPYTRPPPHIVPYPGWTKRPWTGGKPVTPTTITTTTTLAPPTNTIDTATSYPPGVTDPSPPGVISIIPTTEDPITIPVPKPVQHWYQKTMKTLCNLIPGLLEIFSRNICPKHDEENKHLFHNNNNHNHNIIHNNNNNHHNNGLNRHSQNYVDIKFPDPFNPAMVRFGRMKRRAR